MTEPVPRTNLAFDVVQRPVMRQIRRPGPPFGSIRGSVTLSSGLSVPFESLLERRFLDVCRLDHRVSSVASQPFTLTYRSRDDRRRTYTPDFLVTLIAGEGLVFPQSATGVELLVEVKPYRLLRKQYLDLRSRFAAARIWARQAGDRAFLIVTDIALGGAIHGNTLLLSPYLSSQADPTLCVAARALLRQQRSMTLGHLIEHGGPTDEDQWAMQRAVFRMMLCGEIRVSMTSPITKHTVVSLAPENPGL